MMKLFRQLADNGRIVVLVTHATKNVMICDKVAFMAKGGYLAFYGPPEEALTYFEHQGLRRDLPAAGREVGEEWASMFEAPTPTPEQRLPARYALPKPSTGCRFDVQMRETDAVAQSAIKQFMTLTSRSLEILWRSPKDIARLLALAPFLGALNFLSGSPDLRPHRAILSTP